MVEPTESEPRHELDRFIEAMISIHQEVEQIEKKKWPADNNPLVHAPHTAQALMATNWDRPYTREQGAFPAAWTRTNKYWPGSARIDNAYGDRHIVCTCPPIEDYVADAGGNT
jgi:glycine dehydrogenase